MARSVPSHYADVRRSLHPTVHRTAQAGGIKEFTGILSLSEAPEHPELRVHTGSQNLEESVATVVAYLEAQGIITAPAN